MSCAQDLSGGEGPRLEGGFKVLLSCWVTLGVGVIARVSVLDQQMRAGPDQ